MARRCLTSGTWWSLQVFDLVLVLTGVVATDAEQFLRHPRAVATTEVQDQADRLRDLVADGLIRQVDAALHDAGGQPVQGLGGRVGVNRRERAGVAGVEGL